MKYLTNKEIDELDKLIDKRILTLKFLSYSRNQALFHTLLSFEDYLAFVAKKPKADLGARSILYKKIYDGLNHAVQWIFDFCPFDSAVVTKFDDQMLLEATDFLGEGSDYGNLWSQMSLIYKDRNKVRRITPNKFEVSNKSLISEEMGVADNCVGRALDPETVEETFEVTPQINEFIKRSIRIKQVSRNDLDFTVSPEAYISLQKSIKDRCILSWSMDPEWELGDYNFKQLKIFWSTLKVLCHAYNIARSLIQDFELFASLSLRIRSKSEWAKDIKKWSGLPVDVVAQIIEDLIYNPSLSKRGEGKSHVMFQPFFRFNAENLGLSNGIVQISNIERNAWSLTSFLRPKISDRLKNRKEMFWIRELSKKLQSIGLEVFPDIKYKEGNNQKGNIDLLIIDKRINFGLACEMKWLTFTDDVSGKKRSDDVTLVGIDQADRACKWLESHITELAPRINYDEKILQNIEFKPLVINKDNLQSGFLKKSNVPVINEALLNWILFDPHNRHISELWKVADSLSYLPKRGKHYENIPAKIVWGDITFQIKSGAYRLKKRWSPKKDISF